MNMTVSLSIILMSLELNPTKILYTYVYWAQSFEKSEEKRDKYMYIGLLHQEN